MKTTVTKGELVRMVAKTTGVKRPVVRDVVNALIEQIIIEVGRGHRLELRDFGVFENRVRAARVAQNPRTLKPVVVPARRTVKFRPGRLLKRSLGQPGVGDGGQDGLAAGGRAAGDGRPAPVVRARTAGTVNGRARR
jgi:nucleoid DNA-binding protein